MDSTCILIILKKKNGPTGTIFYNIRIYSRSQVSVYRTIGPLVLKVHQNLYVRGGGKEGSKTPKTGFLALWLI